MKLVVRSLLVACLLAAGAQAAPVSRPNPIVPDGIRLVRGSTVVTIKRMSFQVGLTNNPQVFLPTGGAAKPFGEGWALLQVFDTASNKAYCFTWAKETPTPDAPKPTTPVTIFVTKGGAEVERYTFKNAWVKFCGGSGNFNYSVLYSGGAFTSKAKPVAAKASKPGARPLPRVGAQ